MASGFFKDISIERSLGGVKNEDALLSALAVPQHTHEGKDLHQGILAKAAALMRSLIKNHPFIDGNKRTAVLAVLLFLEMNDYTLTMGHTATKPRQSSIKVPGISRTAFMISTPIGLPLISREDAKPPNHNAIKIIIDNLRQSA